jgi:small GTP-binding protein
MGKAYKIVIAGTFNAGKTQFISTVSDIPVVKTERQITDELAQVKEETTVAMDYGQVTVGENLLHLFGTPGQERFNFMWDILAQDTDLLLVMVDSTDRSSFTPARQILRFMRRRNKPPYRVIANKQDLEKAMSPEDVAAALKLDSPDMAIPCNAMDRESVLEALEKATSILD